MTATARAFTRTSIIVLMAAAAGLTQEPSENSKDAAAILAEMTHPKIAFDRFVGLESKLCALPVVDVLPQLVASPHMRMPAGPIYNGGDATIEREYPHAWRLFLSLRRVNVHHRQKAPLAQLKTALMRAHLDGDAAEVELRLYFECWSRADLEHIVDAARKVMKDDTRTMSMRVLGARALLQFEHPRPYQEVVDFTCANGAYASMIDDLLRLFPHPNHPNAKIQRDVLRIAPREPDPRLVACAFEALRAARKKKYPSIFEAEREALRAGQLVGMQFGPNVSDPKWGDSTAEQHAAATVAKALAWWREHAKRN